MTFTRTDFLHVASGNAGGTADEDHVALTTGTGTTSLSYVTSGQRSGAGAWRKVGGTCTAGEFDLSQTTPYTANGNTDLWIGCAFKIASLHSTAALLWVLACNIQGTSGGSSVDKPTCKLKSDGKLYLGSSNTTSFDTLVATLSTGTWYYLWMRARTSTGSTAQEAWLYDGTTGALIANVAPAWDVGNGSASDKYKWWGGTTEDSTGLDVIFEDLAVTNTATASPGPIVIYTRDVSSVTTQGSWAANTGTIPAALAADDGDTTYAVSNTATFTTSLILGLTAASIPSGDDVHTVIAKAVQRHTGSGPVVEYGVKSGATQETLPDYPNSSTSYALRKGTVGGVFDGASHPLDPATAARWTPSAAGAFDGVLRDADTLIREIRITRAYWDVVTAQVPATDVALDPDDATTGTPAASSPALGQTHLLTPAAAATGAPAASSPVLTQDQVLDPDDVAPGTPVASSPTLAQTHLLDPDDATTGAPGASSPSLGSVLLLDPDDPTVGVPMVSSPVLAQTHVLAPAAVTTGTPSATSPVLSGPDVTPPPGHVAVIAAEQRVAVVLAEARVAVVAAEHLFPA